MKVNLMKTISKKDCMHAEAGFEKADEIGDVHIYRKRK